MLSSAVNASRCAFSSLHRRHPCAGRVDDLLAMLGPVDAIFPPSAGRLYANLFRKSIKSRNLKITLMAHAHLTKSGLGAEPLVSNVLLNVYAKAGRLLECSKAFDEMPLKDVVSCCTLISGFVDRGLDLEAFELLKKVICSDLKPNQFVISAVLKGCSNFQSPALGIQVHAVALKSGFAFDSFVEVGLISFYAKHGVAENAMKLFREIPVKCLASWSAMISGYAHLGFFAEAINLARALCRAGFFMDSVTLRVIAGVGSSLGANVFCENLLTYSIKVGLDSDSFVVAELVKILSELGAVKSIGKLFSRVRNPDVCLYALTITGYEVNGQHQEALMLARQLLRTNLSLKPGVFVSLLNLCITEEEGSQLHARILKNGHRSDISVGNALISTYANSKSTEEAEKIFDEMLERDVISWTAVVSCYAHNSNLEEALRIVRSFVKEGIVPDKHMLTAIVNACSATRALKLGQQCHALALTLSVDISEHLSSSFIHMYSKCKDIKRAETLFYSLPSLHSVVPTNAMLAGYNWNSMQQKAVEFFCSERRLMFVPDEFTFSSVLDACSDIMLMETGRQLHTLIIKMGFELFDSIIGNAIMKLYMKSNGYLESAQKVFSQMRSGGFLTSPVALTSLIRGCIDSFRWGKQVHAFVLKTGRLSDPRVSLSVKWMYEKSMKVEGVVENRNKALTGVSDCWSSDCSPALVVYGALTSVNDAAKNGNEALSPFNARLFASFINFFKGRYERFLGTVRWTQVAENCPPSGHFVDLPRNGLTDSTDLNEGQQDLTSGRGGPKIKNLDGIPTLIVILFVNTSELISGVFLDQPKSLQYMDFGKRTHPERKVGEGLRSLRRALCGQRLLWRGVGLSRSFRRPKLLTLVRGRCQIYSLPPRKVENPVGESIMNGTQPAFRYEAKKLTETERAFPHSLDSRFVLAHTELACTKRERERER